MLSQPITVVTGVPGAGKTLYALHQALELQKSGRPVFALGVEGLDPDFCNLLPDDWDIAKWVELPADAVLLIDECHKWLPVRSPGRPPEWIQKLTEIRHFGITLILVTQDVRNIDSFVRRLIGEHVHVSRKAGFPGAMVRTFQGVQEDVNFNHASSSMVPWRYPKDLYKVYKSATKHLIKPKLPLKIWLAIGFAAILVFLVPWVISRFNSVADGPSQTASKTGSIDPKTAFASSSDDEEIKWLTVDDYVKDHKPLLPAIPWTAPVFQDLPLTTVPDMFCSIWDENGPEERCTCYNEQVIKDSSVPSHVCFIIAREGLYNPYRNNVGPAGASNAAPAGPGDPAHTTQAAR